MFAIFNLRGKVASEKETFKKIVTARNSQW